MKTLSSQPVTVLQANKEVEYQRSEDDAVQFNTEAGTSYEIVNHSFEI